MLASRDVQEIKIAIKIKIKINYLTVSYLRAWRSPNQE